MEQHYEAHFSQVGEELAHTHTQMQCITCTTMHLWNTSNSFKPRSQCIRSDLNQQPVVLSPGSKWKPCFYFEGGLPRLWCMRLESSLSWFKINVGWSERLSVFNHSCWPAAEQFWRCKCKCLCHFQQTFVGSTWLTLWCEHQLLSTWLDFDQGRIVLYSASSAPRNCCAGV